MTEQGAQQTVRDRLFAIAMEKGLRQSTVLSYERLLGRLGILDEVEVSQEDVLSRLWTIDNPNTRRAAVIALRSVFGWRIKIPRGVPRRYDLPDEDTLRLALMTSPHEVRGLLMMYAGLRIGEASAVTMQSVSGDRLTVDKQVIQLRRTGHPTVTRIGPVKSSEATVIIPHWLTGLVATLEGTEKPDCVRESLRRAGRKVGIGLTPHMLRHWYATTMLERGVPLPLVQQQMRHSDIAVTLRTYVQYRAAGSIHDTFG
jgi:integrase